jgi:Flp pilus assembly protein TadG
MSRAGRAKILGEQGSVSLVVATGALIALILTMGVADVGKALTARARARAAADAAALAVAQELAIPSGLDLSQLASTYAGANGAELISCDCAEGSFEARVVVRAPVGDLLLVPGRRHVEGRALAVVDLPSYLSGG